MAKTLQLRRGTTAQNDAFTGAVGELSVDTTKKTLRLHDGTTAGGKEIIGKPDLATVATSGSYTDLSNKPTVDSSLSTTSTNAVQNKVVKSALDAKLNTSAVDSALSTTSTNPVQNKVINTALGTKLNTADLNTALTELITEYGGTVPS